MFEEETFLNIPGGKIRTWTYRPESVRSDASLVFLHDALGSVEQWKDFPRLLADACSLKVFAYDRFGSGGSSPLPQYRDKDYLHLEAARFLPRILEEMAIDQPLLIGHSDGGSIALIYAAMFQPVAILTEAAHVMVEDITLEGIREAVKNRDLLIDKLQKYHGDQTETLFNAWSETWLNERFRNWDILDLLPSIECPALVIQGEADKYGTAEQVRLIKAGIGPSCQTWMLPDCGHIPHLEMKERVLEKMSKFIDGVVE